jgi:hypothetical protein
MKLHEIKSYLKSKSKILPLHAQFWTVKKDQPKRVEKEESEFYNSTHIKIYKFHKPISKIINFSNAHQVK